jgi:hypothetical protein
VNAQPLTPQPVTSNHPTTNLLELARHYTEELARLHVSLAQVRMAELQVRQVAWERSNDSTVTGRTRAMDFASQEYARMALEHEGDIKALTVRLAQIDRELQYQHAGTHGEVTP